MSLNENNKNSELSDATVQMVVTQTSYTKEEAMSKLSDFNNDPIKVIRDFMGLNDKTSDLPHVAKTKSQERYRIIREEIYKDNYTKQLQNRS